MNRYHVRAAKNGSRTTVLGPGWIYCLSWQVQDGKIDGDGLLVTLEDVEKRKTAILAIAELK